METEVAYEAGEGKHHVKQAIQGQNLFGKVVANATSVVMRVNNAKTHLISISDSLTFKAHNYIIDGDGDRLDSSDDLKLLGFLLTNLQTICGGACESPLETAPDKVVDPPTP